jgi:hypothetical protein
MFIIYYNDSSWKINHQRIGFLNKKNNLRQNAHQSWQAFYSCNDHIERNVTISCASITTRRSSWTCVFRFNDVLVPNPACCEDFEAAAPASNDSIPFVPQVVHHAVRRTRPYQRLISAHPWNELARDSPCLNRYVLPEQYCSRALACPIPPWSIQAPDLPHNRSYPRLDSPIHSACLKNLYLFQK